MIALSSVEKTSPLVNLPVFIQLIFIAVDFCLKKGFAEIAREIALMDLGLSQPIYANFG